MEWVQEGRYRRRGIGGIDIESLKEFVGKGGGTLYVCGVGDTQINGMVAGGGYRIEGWVFPQDGRYFSFCLYADEVISRVGKLSNVLEEARRNGI